MAKGPSRTAHHRESPRFRRVSKQLGRRLTLLRFETGLTQEVAAEKMGIGVAALRRLETGGDNNPSLAVLVSAAAAYGLEVWELLDPSYEIDR